MSRRTKAQRERRSLSMRELRARYKEEGRCLNYPRQIGTLSTVRCNRCHKMRLRVDRAAYAEE